MFGVQRASDYTALSLSPLRMRLPAYSIGATSASVERQGSHRQMTSFMAHVKVPSFINNLILWFRTSTALDHSLWSMWKWPILPPVPMPTQLPNPRSTAIVL